MTVMKRALLLLIAVVAMFPAAASAGGLSVNVWADRGADAVYEPGDRVQIRARCSDDANLLVYDIDAEGYVHVLFPYRGRAAYVDGRQTFMIPASDASDELVVRGPVGQGYVVAIASRAPFRDLPWYLRPYDPQGEGVGYVGGPEHSGDEDEGVTPEGRIVGDPFVAIERIRREVVSDPEDRDDVTTAYFSYYVHDRVRYPRYVCNDCHRPGHYAWWGGFDPYYASCSVVDFRVNYGWFWGTPYWSGFVPYYVFVVRPYAPPFYRPWAGNCFSSWDGWRRWDTMWGSHLIRYKPASPPPGYIPPTKYKWDRRWQGDRPAPPGFLTAAGARAGLQAQRMPISGSAESGIIRRTDWRPDGELRRPVTRAPLGEAPRERDAGGRTIERPRRGVERAPLGSSGGGGSGSSGGGREGRPTFEPPRSEPPRSVTPRTNETPRTDRRWEGGRSSGGPPRSGPPRFERPGTSRGDSRHGERPTPRSGSPRYERPSEPRGERPAHSGDDNGKSHGDRADSGRRGGGR